MGALTSGFKTFLYDTLLFSSRLSASLKSNTQLHTARFANLHETAGLSPARPT